MNYDHVGIENKKYLDKKIEKQKKLTKVMEFCGVLDGGTKNLTSQKIKHSKKAKY